MKYNNELLNRMAEVKISQVDGLPNIGFYKKGGIHIKKSHRGRFTEYCGGKVTSECIAKGKRSPDPKIRKQATFASNSRSWNKK